MGRRLGVKAQALRLLKPVHRYLGLGLSIILLLWFLSGIVMMFHAYPRTADSERVAELAELSPGEVRLSLGEAVEQLDGDAPSSLRINQPGERPMIQMRTPEDGWRAVYADDGEPVAPLDEAKARSRARALGAENIGEIELLESGDQWTVSGHYDSWRPLWRVSVEDEQGSVWYLSQATHEKIHSTTRSERLWGYAGAVVHWIYPTQLRELSGFWRQLVMWLAGLGGLACLSGLIIGVLSLRRRRGQGMSHYRGWLLWHHYLGLAFGVLAFTWLLSGLLSMMPGYWASSDRVAPSHIEVSLGASDTGDLEDWPELAELTHGKSEALSLRELEPWQFNDRNGFRAMDADGDAVFLDPEKDHHDGRPSAAEIREAAEDVKDLELTGFEKQKDYDNYYYPGRSERVRGSRPPLPVYRADYEEDIQLYIDPDTGAVRYQSTPRGRANRWLYNGLHSLDFPFLNPGSLGWYILMLALLGVGVIFSGTGVWLTIRYLRGRSRQSG